MKQRQSGFTLVTEAVNSTSVQLHLTLTPNSGSGAVNWVLTGTGCAVTTPGRGIKC
jgi:type IV pilus assembly protein PilA